VAKGEEDSPIVSVGPGSVSGAEPQPMGAGAGAEEAKDAPSREPLPFGLKVVIFFFVADAFEKIAQGLHLLQGGVPLDRAHLERYYPILLVVLFDVLLATQLALRTQAGRFWSIIYLSANVALALYFFTAEPLRWLELSLRGRAMEIATLGVDLGLILYLAAPAVLARLRSS